MAEGGSIDEEIDDKLCNICLKDRSKYVCPRCNVAYCSLPCYQSEKHIECSEAFYKDCIMEDLKVNGDDPNVEKTMVDILKRFNEEAEGEEDVIDSDDDEDAPELADRMARVNLDDADEVWGNLVESERREFEELVRSGCIGEMLPPYKPWWTFGRERSKLVEVMDPGGPAVTPAPVNHPALVNVPPFSEMTRSPPSPVVKFNVLNVLAAYCYVVRRFGGDHHNFAREASMDLVLLSDTLDLNHNHTTALFAVEAVSQQAVNRTWLNCSPEAARTMRADVEAVLNGPDCDRGQLFTRAALSDVHQLLSAAVRPRPSKSGFPGPREFSRRFPDRPHDGAEKLSKSKLQLCRKKMEFYIAWAWQFAEETYSGTFFPV